MKPTRPQVKMSLLCWFSHAVNIFVTEKAILTMYWTDPPKQFRGSRMEMKAYRIL
jgi:hypothetical protein